MTETLEERFTSHGDLTAYLAGRLAGLAGTVRHDLTDEDREALKVAANVLESIAKREVKQGPLHEGTPYRVVEDQDNGQSTVTPLSLAAMLGVLYRQGLEAVKNGGKVDVAFIDFSGTDFEREPRPRYKHVWK